MLYPRYIVNMKKKAQFQPKIRCFNLFCSKQKCWLKDCVKILLYLSNFNEVCMKDCKIVCLKSTAFLGMPLVLRKLLTVFM